MTTFRCSTVVATAATTRPRAPFAPLRPSKMSHRVVVARVEIEGSGDKEGYDAASSDAARKARRAVEGLRSELRSTHHDEPRLATDEPDMYEGMPREEFMASMSASASGMTDRAQGAVDSTSQKASEVASDISSGAEGLTDTAKAKAASARESVQEGAEEAKERGKGIVGSIKEKASSVVEGVKETIEEKAESGRRKIEEAREENDEIEEGVWGEEGDTPSSRYRSGRL